MTPAQWAAWRRYLAAYARYLEDRQGTSDFDW